jgi:hypothetical protein
VKVWAAIADCAAAYVWAWIWADDFASSDGVHVEYANVSHDQKPDTTGLPDFVAHSRVARTNSTSSGSQNEKQFSAPCWLPAATEPVALVGPW